MDLLSTATKTNSTKDESREITAKLLRSSSNPQPHYVKWQTEQLAGERGNPNVWITIENFEDASPEDFVYGESSP